jgi:hypothetical protein
MTEIMNARFRKIVLNDLINNNEHASWEIGGGPIGYIAVMNEIRDAEGTLILSWVENVKDDDGSGFQDCVNFRQLESGRWAGHTLCGTYVTRAYFIKGEYPDRFKYEQSQIASEEEAIEYWERHS